MARVIERYLAPLFLFSCLVLGGASAAGHLANGVLQLAGLGVILLLLLNVGLPALSGRATLLLAMFGAGAALIAIQLIPLPPALWSLLPGRSKAYEGFLAVGIDPPWLPVSMVPSGTVAALLALIPPLAMVLTIFVSSGYGRLYAIYTLVAVAIGSIFFGILQRYEGPDSAFYLYEITNRGGLVAFFANRNHLSTLLLTSLPFLAALAISPSRKAAVDKKVGRRMMTGCAILFISVGVVIVKSVAGWLLLLPTLFACLMIYQRGEVGKYSVASATTAVVVTVIALALALFAPLNTNDLGDKLSGVGPQQRNESISATLKAGVDHLPFGSGGGSFLSIYPTYEDASEAGGEYVSHAHSDYAEVFLEYGIPGMMLVAALLFWWGSSFASVWGSWSRVGAFGRAGFAAVGIVIVHSVVDYPLRTAAIAAVAAMAAALMVAPEPVEAPTSQYRRRRKRKKSNRSIYLIPDDNPAPVA